MAVDLKSQILSDTSRIVFEATSSLKNQCINVLIDQIIRSNDNFADKLRGSLANLPFRLRIEMLKKLEFVNAERGNRVEMEKTAETALTLICGQISSFNFKCLTESAGNPQLRKFCRKKEGIQQQKMQIIKIYKLLAERNSVSLLKLVHSKKLVKIKYSSYEEEDYMDKIAPSVFDSVLRLKNLKVLHLTKFAISQRQFKILCQTLVNIQNLSFHLLDVNEKYFTAALKNLTKLEQFEFVASCIGGFSMLCSSLLDKFPKLKVIGPRVNDLSKFNMCHSLTNIRTWSEPSQLEHLSINQQLTVEQALMLPNVKALRLSSKNCSFKFGFGAVMMMEKLTSLTVDGELDRNSLRHLFGRIGPYLEEVTFINANSSNHDLHYVDDLLSFCPNMKTLNTSFIPFDRYFANFNHLTKICIDGEFCHISGRSLCLFFSPPKLEVVELWRIDIKGAELKDAVEIMGSEANCSPQLREIRGSIDLDEPHYFNDSKITLELWDQFFQFVCIHSLKLKVFDFLRGTNNDVSFWLTKTIGERNMTE